MLKNNSKIRKAVFPVAGLGTRFLPATKASPKEMLPIVDKPLIQYAAEEAIDAGITHLIFITGRGKGAIEDHFDVSYELENELKQRQKLSLLSEVQQILPKGVDAVFIRQPMALGLGHAVCMAKNVVGDETFAVLLADDLIDSDKPCLSQMVERYYEYGGSLLGVQNVAQEKINQYGIVETKNEPIAAGLTQISGIVEKPEAANAPSSLGVVGRYILSPQIFSHLENTEAGTGGEIQLTDAIARLLKEEPVYAYEFEGTRYDCGSKLGYLEATVNYALKHKDLADDFRAYLKGIQA